MIARRTTRRRAAVAAALIALVASSAGCTHRQAMTTITAGAGVIGAGLLVHAGTRDPCTRPSGEPCFGSENLPAERMLGTTLLVGAGLVLVAQLVAGDADAGAPPETMAERTRAAALLADPAIHVRVLTVQARDWARHGRCDVVRRLGAQVAALDPGYHATVFAADPVLAGCLR